MRSYSICALLILFGISVYSQIMKINIAVNDLSAKNIQQSDAEIISERLRSELHNTGVFKVMERNDMSSILKEQGFQRTGACDEASCLVEVGQLLGVDRMVAGSIGKISSMHTISLRMINVTTGEIMFTVNEDYQGDLSGVLTTAVGNASLKLARGAGGEIAKAAMSGKTGDLYITSVPSNAEVEIDGEKIAGVTPLTLKEVAAGEHRIIVRKSEYYSSKTVSLTPDDLLKVDLTMEKGRGSLKVFSIPDSADVHIDGCWAGTTPCKVDIMMAGEHDIAFNREGYIQYKSTVTIGVAQIENVSVTLKPAGYVSVSCDVSSAHILINGKEAGLGKVEQVPVAVGLVEIAIEASGFEPFSRTLDLAQGAHEMVQQKMVSVFGSLSVTSEPTGARVFLKEQDVGTTPYTNNHLQPGDYVLRVQLDTYEPVNENVPVAKNNSITKKYDLKHTSTWFDSVKTAQKKIHKQQQWVRRIMFGSFAAGSFFGGVYYNSSVLDGYDKQKKIQQEYDQVYGNIDVKEFQIYENRYNIVKSKTQDDAIKRNLLYGLAGLFAAGLLISIPF